MENFLIIGEIVKPQGIKGEVKLRPYSDEPNRIKQIKKVYIDDRAYEVLSVKVAPDAVFLGLSGIFTRNDAELYRGKIVKVKREDAPKLKKGNFYIVDVIGCTLFTSDGEEIGVVEEIIKGVQDVYIVKGKNATISFPLLNTLNYEIDVENKKMVVDKKRFLEVSLYENWYFNPFS